MDDAEDGEESEGGTSPEGKRHICPICAKRFNRPSSLRIHVNTHTGATPFRCPHPSCGRAFNVNSNMRRHFRNHAHTTSKPTSGVDYSTTTSPSATAGFNSKSPAVVTSFKYRPAPSPTSPPSAGWSASTSSISTSSPLTPASPSAIPPFIVPTPFDCSLDCWRLASSSTRRNNKFSAHTSPPEFEDEDGDGEREAPLCGYSESDVRSAPQR
ncbi:hypothetical protein B0H12DRAFT_1033176 [Mycena haematopus]|nr:hypothetical protein B0H12DRAFT_1033176 [Mycena haematopus]